MAGTSPGTLSPGRVVRRSLVETVAAELLDEIRRSGLPAGSRLPTERALMESLGVGRSSLREAINGLAMLGVVEQRHGQGVFVADPDAAEPTSLARALARGVTAELFEARLLIEPEAARLAARRRTPADLHELARALDDHAAALAADDPAVEPSVRFHMQVAAAAHNDVLAGFAQSLAEPLAERGPILEAVDGFRAWELDQHRAVFAPIEAGDPDLAAARMRGHLEAVLPYHERIGLD